MHAVTVEPPEFPPHFAAHEDISLPQWQTIAADVKAAFAERSRHIEAEQKTEGGKPEYAHAYPSERAPRDGYFRDRSRRSENDFIDAAVKYTLHVLGDHENEHKVYRAFLRREVQHGYEMLKRDYAHQLKPATFSDGQKFDEWRGLEPDVEDGRKRRQMNKIFEAKETHAQNELNRFVSVIDKDIRRSFAEHGIDERSLRHLLHEKGIEDPSALPFALAVQPERAPAGRSF